jgi:hypothetical protein
MRKEESIPKKKKPYVEPKVIATYEKEELDETLTPEGGSNFFVSLVNNEANGA